MRPRLIERKGPTNVILTTTMVRLHAENETRLISLPVTDTREQTAAVMRRMAEGRPAPIDLAPWHALQEWLAGADNRVDIPFACKLADLVPAVAVRLRRDFGAVLALIAAHAVLHQESRERDAEGRIIATIEDYRAVPELVGDLIADGVGAGVPSSIRETVRAVTKILEERGTEHEASNTEVAAALRLDKSAASRRVKAALEAGFLTNREDRKGRPAKIVIGEPMPEEMDILPKPEVLQGCSRAARDAPALPPCPACGGTRFWRYPTDPVGRRACGTCQPPSHPAAAIWLDER
jgi:hypothetical protein